MAIAAKKTPAATICSAMDTSADRGRSPWRVTSEPIAQLMEPNTSATAPMGLMLPAWVTHVATLVERQSRFVQLIKVRGKDTDTVVRALTRHVQRLPDGLMASLTWDRGLEMAQHQRFTIATDVAVYFCDPQSPWQRGTNENTNGLLRQYLPKGTDLSTVTQAKLNAIGGA